MSYVDSDWAKLSDCNAPTKVTNFELEVPTKQYANYVDLKWDKAQDNIAVDHYNVYRSMEQSFENTELIAEVEETSYRDESVSKPAVYFYKVEAEDEDKNKGEASEILSVEAGANVALGKNVESSGSDWNAQVQNAVDGKGDTAWSSSFYSGQNGWMLVDLNENTIISEIVIKHGGGAENNTDFTIEVSNDKENWNEVANIVGNKEDITRHKLMGINTRYVRVNVSKGGQYGRKAKICELQINTMAIEKAPEEKVVINSIESMGNGKVEVKFSPVNLATSFKIKYGTEPGKYTKEIKDIKAVSCTIEGLQAGEGGKQTYYFVVIPVNKCGEGPVSEENKITIDLEKPSKVTNLKFKVPTKVYAKYVELSWDASTDNIGVEHYNIYRSTDKDFKDVKLIAEVKADKETKYIDKDIIKSATYFYKVEAVDGQKNVSEPSEIVSTPAGTNIAIGKSVEGTSSSYGDSPLKNAVDGDEKTMWDCYSGMGDNWISVDLGEITNISEVIIKHAGGDNNNKDFKVEISSDKEKWTEAANVTDNTEDVTKHQIIGGNARYVKVTVSKGSGYYGRTAKIRELEINAEAIEEKPKDAAVISSIESGKNGTATINFQPVNMATSYKIKYGTKSGEYTEEIDNITSISYVVEGLQPGENGQQTYYFVVVATNPYGDGPVSEEISITIDIEAPSKVENLKAVTPSAKYSAYVDLSWDRATDNVGVDHYNVYRAAKEDLSDKVLIASPKETSYRDEDADIPSKYYYIVKAADEIGNESTEESNKVSAEAGNNVGFGKLVEVSGQVKNEEGAQNLVDGDLTTKWCDAGSSNYWAIVDLEKETPISKIVLVSAGDQEEAVYNTRAYKIEVSNDKNDWTEVVNIKDNSKTTREHEVKNAKGRYVRLSIPKKESVQIGNSAYAARIYELKILAGKEAMQPTKDFTITHKFNLGSLTAGERLEAALDIINNTEEAQPVKAIMALYDENNTLIKVNGASSNIASGEAVSLKPAFDLPDNTDKFNVKVFVWNGTSLQDSNMIPLAKPIVMKNN